MDDKLKDNGPSWPRLDAMKEQVERLEIPADIDKAIRSGIREGSRRRRNRLQRRFAYYAACLLFATLIASVRFSPAVAAYVEEIPGFRSLVKLINHDKGLRLALENDFMQPVGLSEEHDGIKLTIDGILADESRVIVFYTLNNTDGRKRIVNVQDVDLINYEDVSISHGTSDFKEDWESKQGTIDFTMQEGKGIPDVLELEMKIGENNHPTADGPKWNFVIAVDKAKFEGLKRTYAINRTVSVEDQRITFGTMTVYPTRIGLEVTYDSANTKKLFYFDDIRIEDERGEPFGTIANGVLASNISDDRIMLYFQSNYFRKPDRLYLRAGSIRALDKDKLEVQVDLGRKVLLSRPDDRLELADVGTSAEDGRYVLDFRLNNDDPLDQNRAYGLFNNGFKDASGRTFDSNRTGSSSDHYQYYIGKQNYLSPLTITISDYPSRIYGDINLKVK